MKQRCFNHNNDNWDLYGGRGVSICPEWLEFIGFSQWAEANGYAEDLEIDRKDSGGNYEPGNCQWVTEKIQARNTNRRAEVAAFGESKCLPAWIEDARCVVGYETLRARIFKYRWDAEKAITTPLCHA
jgi:hypothetical protein